MKKIMIALIAVIFSCSAMAQNTKMSDTGMHKMSDTTRNGAAMIGGKMMTMMNGQMMPMTQTMTTSDGTMVMTDGSVKMKNGKTTMLKEGYGITMDGKMKKMPMKKGMMRDTTKM